MITPPPYNTAINGYNHFMDDVSSTPADVESIQPSAPTQPHLNPNLALAGGGLAAGPKQVRARKAIRGLGITQIVLGVLLAVFSITLIVSSAVTAVGHPYYYSIVGVDGSGIWGGILSGIAGIFAVLVSGRASKCYLVTCMVLSIIGAVAAGIGLILDGIWLATAEYMAGRRNRDPGLQPNPMPLVACAGGIALSIVNVAVSACCASLMCVNASCCCCSNKQAKTVVVAIPMEKINEVLSKNNAEANANFIVVPYKP